MHLTRYTDYSLRVLMCLAVRPNELGTIGAIAEVFEISRNHLTKVVQDLSRRGYIDTVRGKGGGLRLRLAPEKISVGRVVRDMEPDLFVVECLHRRSDCIIAPRCELKRALVEATQAFLAVLDGYTLADIVANRDQLIRLLDLSGPVGTAATP